MDSTIIDNFIYRLLGHIRESPEFIGRRVVLLMDNASIHHHRRVIDTVLRCKAILLFSAQYSPWLNPVEKFFRFLKEAIKKHPTATR